MVADFDAAPVTEDQIKPMFWGVFIRRFVRGIEVSFKFSFVRFFVKDFLANDYNSADKRELKFGRLNGIEAKGTSYGFSTLWVDVDKRGEAPSAS